jgi:hypothetical protein
MTREEIIALAERCEKATGPDRELSDDILRAIGWRTESRGFRNINGSTESVAVWLRPGQDFSRDDFRWLEDEAANNAWSSDEDWRPNVTASLDAAMTLLPEGTSAVAILREAIDALVNHGSPVEIDALPRFVTAAALRAKAASL